MSKNVRNSAPRLRLKLAALLIVIAVLVIGVVVYNKLPITTLRRKDKNYSAIKLPDNLTLASKKCDTGDFLDNQTVGCSYTYKVTESDRQALYQSIKSALQAQDFSVTDRQTTIDHVIYDPTLSGTVKYKTDDQSTANIFNSMNATNNNLLLNVSLKAPSAYAFDSYNNEPNVAINDKVTQLTQTPVDEVIIGWRTNY